MIKIKTWKVQDIKPAEYNPRYLTDKQEDDLTESIIRFGFIDPLIININDERYGILIGGHQREKIAIKFLEWLEQGDDYAKGKIQEITEADDEDVDLFFYANVKPVIKGVPCVELDLNLEQEKELNVRLNKNGGEFDILLLKQNFEVEDLMEWGFEDFELGLEDFETDEVEKIKEEKVEVEVSAGDCWRLGDHIIIVGEDSVKIIADTIKKWNKSDAGTGDEAEKVENLTQWKKDNKRKF